MPLVCTPAEWGGYKKTPQKLPRPQIAANRPKTARPPLPHISPSLSEKQPFPAILEHRFFLDLAKNSLLCSTWNTRIPKTSTPLLCELCGQSAVWRNASKTPIPTAVARFKLRASVRIGILKQDSAFAWSNDSGSPFDSLPKTNQSPF